MIGRAIEQEYPFAEDVELGETLFEAKHITTSKVHDVSLSLRRGEIVGLAGLVGSGRTELLRALFGADASDGDILINQQVQKITSPKKAVQAGMSFITEDRKNQGLILDLEIYKNISLASLHNYQRRGFMQPAAEIAQSEKNRQELHIKSASSQQHVRYLSGGNQQKVIFSKWLNVSGDVMLLDEPTRGIDVGAKYEIYLLLNELARQKKCILVASSDIHELIGICHRIIVMSNGSVSGEVLREDFNPTDILSLSYKHYLS